MSTELPLLLDSQSHTLILIYYLNAMRYNFDSQYVDTAIFSIYFYILCLQDHVTACLSVFHGFLYFVLCLVIVSVLQGTHYWWWLSSLWCLVLRVETPAFFIRLFCFCLFCQCSCDSWFVFVLYSVVCFEFGLCLKQCIGEILLS